MQVAIYLLNNLEAEDRMMKLNRSGYSLIEMMVAVAILSVLVMAAIPNLQIWSANQRLRSDISSLQGDLQVARITAINRSAPVTLQLNAPAANQYRVFIDDGRTGGTARDLVQNGGEPLILQGSLANGVSFSTINLVGNAVLFNGRGLRARPMLDPADVTVQNGQGRQFQIFISLTGDINGNYL